MVGSGEGGVSLEPMASPRPITAAPSRAAARPPLFKHPWRVAIVVVTVLVALNLVVVLLNESDTTQAQRTPVPADIQSISPKEGELVGLVDTVTVDLADQYSGVLVIDGIEIPEDELDRVVSLQQVSFRPGPDRAISRFRAGDNTVVVKYWRGRLEDRPRDPFSFGWTFRAGA
jgi:hypothetical protein